MTKSLLRIALTSAAAFALLGAASAATSVFDNASGESCFAAARVGDASGGTMAACDAAIDSASLPPRDLAATYVNRAVLHLDAHDAAAALSDTETALRLAPGLHDAAINKAGALLMLGRAEEARGTLDAVLPELSGAALERALYNRALAHEALGDVPAAYHDYKRAAELDPKFEAATVELARFQVK